MHKRNFESILGAKRSRMGSNYLEKRKPGGGGGLDTSVLGELNPPKNSKIPQRNHEIAKGGSWGTLTVVHEK
jgi:hypothetical protein